MLLNFEFLDYIIVKHTSGDLIIHITNEEAQILASTDIKRRGTKSSTAQYILQVMQPATIGSLAQEAGFRVAYGAPLYSNKELCGSVIVHGAKDAAFRQGELIRVSIESALDYALYSQNREQPADPIASIARLLLQDKPDTGKLLSMMNSQELDPSLLRTVICISLKFHQTSYFNINLNLGYQSSIERLRAEAVTRLKTGRYLNSQDMVYLYNENTIAIIKSFIPASDHTRVYPALDNICQDLEKTLNEFSAFSFGIAYGNLSYGIAELNKSLNEALGIISIGQRARPNERRFVLEHILFDNVCHYLYPQIISKIIEPAIAKLAKKDGSIPEELISCAEDFVDNCMSFSKTSNNHLIHRNTISTRLEKIKSLTGLDPANNFRDAFIVKMLATYIRQHDLWKP
ncbi:MAG: helix-turn-helix domain-containing protein [Spirochaetes bacterium]|nr:helix-turn-helix domain-containing protein [Spirochaetota bacterium]